MRTVCKERDEENDKTYDDISINKDIDIHDGGDMAKIYEMLLKLKEENNDLKKKMNKIEKAPNISNVTNNTTNNMTNCNINNGTVNNIYLVGYGKEDMSKIDRSDLLKGMRLGFNSTLKMIDTIHFNPKYPEFHNVYISSMKNKYAMMYDGNDWTLVMKDDLIDKMYNTKRNYIEENMDEFLDSLTKSQINALHRWLGADDDHPYIEKIKNDIKLLLYNKRKMAIEVKANGNMIYQEHDDNESVPEKQSVDMNDAISKKDKIEDIASPLIVDVTDESTNVKKITPKRKQAGRPGTHRKVSRLHN